jgi:hypothetical protein
MGDLYVMRSRSDGEASIDEFGKAVGMELKEPDQNVPIEPGDREDREDYDEDETEQTDKSSGVASRLSWKYLIF